MTNVTLWPKDEQRPALMVMGVLVFSAAVSFAYTFVIPPLNDPDSTVSNVMLGAITFLLGVIVWVLKKGYATLTAKMDSLGRQQQAFVVAVVQITVETHPDKAEEIMGRFAPLLQGGWKDKG